MLDFSAYIPLPAIWGGIILLAVIMYVLLDGFDLGVGIIFPFAPSDACRNKMMNSIAPFWDGNETWLILGGGGLFAAFPLAYAIIMPATYIPVLMMLVALIFRGIAFEFRFKTEPKNRIIWDLSFHFGSLFASFMQGIILGTIIQGIQVDNYNFVGKPFDWLTGFSVVVGIAVVFGYALLGACWVNMKSTGKTQKFAQSVAKYTLIYVLLFMGVVSIWMPFIDIVIFDRWFSTPNIFYLSPIPVISLYIAYKLFESINAKAEYSPFLYTMALFTLGFIGIVISIWPYVIPRSVTFAKAAARGPTQSLMLLGIIVTLPAVLSYTAYNYYVFRGKAQEEAMY